MFWNKINNESRNKEKRKDIIDFILDMQKDISLIKERISNIEYEIKKN